MTAAEFLEIDKSFSPLFEDDSNKSRIKTIEEHLKFSIAPPKTKQFCLIGEGNLKKICRKELKDRYFALFSHCLIYCNFPPSDRVSMKKPLLKTTVLQMTGMTVEACRDVKVGENSYAFCLKIQTPEKSFIVVTETENEQQAWENHIQCAIIHSNFNGGNRSQKKSKNSAGPKREAAPVWIPDQNFTVCPVCQKNKFTALNRRHHCRKCGTLMCGECQRYFEDKVKKKKEKICVMCHNKTKSGAVPASQLVPLPQFVSPEERNELKRQQQEAAKENRNEANVPASSLVQFPKLESDSSDDDYDSSDEE